MTLIPLLSPTTKKNIYIYIYILITELISKTIYQNINQVGNEYESIIKVKRKKEEYPIGGFFFILYFFLPNHACNF
jgi:hypothetical protein